MNRIIFLLAGATIMFAGCSKVQSEEVIPEKGQHVVKLKASVDETDTRVSVDMNNASANFSWEQDDWIIVLTEYQSHHDGGKWIQLYNDGPTVEFEVTLDNDVTLGKYAFYPAAEKTGYDEEYDLPIFGVSDNYEYCPGNTNIPLLGTITSSEITAPSIDYYETTFKASFKAVGGLLKVEVHNVPEDLERMDFTVEDKMIAGCFPAMVGPDGERVIETKEYVQGNPDESNTIRFNIMEVLSEDMVFFIPLPCGTYNNLRFDFYEFGNCTHSKTARIDNNGNGSIEPGEGITITRNEIIVAPPLEL